MDKPVLALIDMGLFWAYYRARKPEEELDQPRIRFVGMCRAIATKHTRTIVCADSPHLFRRSLPGGDAYKRRPDKTAEEAGELANAEAELNGLGLVLSRADGYEADDLIASYAMAAKETWRVRIYSDDKDVEAVVDHDAVTVYKKDRAKGGHKDWAHDDVMERRRCPPERIPELLALMGDAADGIPGVTGIGEEAATAILNAYPGHVLDAWKDLDPDGLPGRPLADRIRKALAKGREAFNISFALARLDLSAPIDKGLLAMPEPTPPFQDAAPVDVDVNTTHETIREAQGEREVEVIRETAAPPSIASVLDEVAERTSQKAKAEGWIGTRFEDRLEPKNLHEAWLLAGHLDRAMSPGKGKNSPAQRTYAKIGNREAIFAVILKGTELNLPAMLSLAHIKPVEGKLEVDAMLMMAIALRSGRVSAFRWIETTDDRATIEITVDGRAIPYTWTIQTAEKAGLYPVRGDGAAYSPWMKYTRVMLRWRAVSEVLRANVPEAVTGLYAYGEIGEIEEEDVRRGLDVEKAVS